MGSLESRVVGMNAVRRYQPAPLWKTLDRSVKVYKLLVYLSPNPCAQITVAVCFFSAGTTRGAAVAIVYYVLSDEDQYPCGLRVSYFWGGY